MKMKYNQTVLVSIILGAMGFGLLVCGFFSDLRISIAGAVLLAIHLEERLLNQEGRLQELEAKLR